MKKEKILYIIHCIDTEGPLNESLSKTFQRLKSIFGISIKPSKANLVKIQNKQINFGSKTEDIANVFSKKLLNYNNTWKKIKKMQKKNHFKKF